MLSFVGISRSGSHQGPWADCIAWCRDQVRADHTAVAHVLLCRGGEKQGRVVAEVTADNERRVTGGRVVPLRGLKQCRA